MGYYATKSQRNVGLERPLIGQIIDDTYKLTRQIGVGGMGSIWEAEHVRVGRMFALKFLNVEIAGDREVFERFRREAEIAGRLGHPNIIEVVDFKRTDDGTPFMVMECLEGEDLAERIAGQGPFGLQAAMPLIGDTVDALDAAHAAGVVHRDLKPQNIFLARRGRQVDVIKLLDFGISKIKASGTIQTKTNAVMGTPYYMSPEQAQGQVKDIDARTDIFAMGAIVYEMLTGRIAFYAPTAPSAMFKVCFEQPSPIRELLPMLPDGFDRVLDKALHKERDERYGSILSFWEDLERVAGGHEARLSTGKVHKVLVHKGEAADQERAAGLTHDLSDTTMSGATGEAPAAVTLPPPSKGRGALIGIGAAVGVLVIAAALYFGLRTRDRPAASKAGGAPPAETTMDPKAGAMEHKDKVTITVLVRPKAAQAEIWVNGQKIRGRSFTQPYSIEAPVNVKVRAPGYKSAGSVVMPNRDKVLEVELWKGKQAAAVMAMEPKPTGRRRRRRRRRPAVMTPSMTSTVMEVPARPRTMRPATMRPATMRPATMGSTMKGPVSDGL